MTSKHVVAYNPWTAEINMLVRIFVDWMVGSIFHLINWREKCIRQFLEAWPE